MSISVVIPHFFHQRRSNLLSIVRAHNTSTMSPDEILIWNNDRPFDIVPENVTVIQSNRNIGCKARFLAAMAAKGDWILFQDNDVMPEADTLRHMLSFSGNYPGRAILALEGRRLLKYASYKDSVKVDGRERTELQSIDISLARLELVPRTVVNELLSDIPFTEDTIMDDIAFSHAADLHGVPKFVVPYRAGQGFINLNEGGVGAWISNPEHFAQRNLLCEKFWPQEKR